MTVKPSDVLFVWSRGIVQNAIEAITDGPSHVALFIDQNVLAEANGGRRVGDVPFSFYTSGRSERLEVWRDPTLSDADRTAMTEYAKTFYGDRYDYALIPLEAAHYVFGVKLSWYREHRRFICSTYVTDVAKYANKRWSNVSNPAPIDVMNGGALKPLYTWRDGAWSMELPMQNA